MTRTVPVRRLLALGVTLAATAGGGLTTGVAASAAADAAPARASATTKVTFRAPHCEGCTIGVYSISPDGQSGWGAGPTSVVDDLATFKVPTSRTTGLVAVVDAPWDGDLGYTTTVVLRYGGRSAGDAVTTAQAVRSTKGSSCWAGTKADAVTIPLTVKQVTVTRPSGEMQGTLAFARTTRRWWAPMKATHEGVVRAKGSITCSKP
jgi:hypothetical protein